MLAPLPTKEGDWKPPMHYELMLRSKFSNVTEEWDRMELWLRSNKNRQKTSRGMPRFVGNWMMRSGKPQVRPQAPQMPVAAKLTDKDRERGRGWLDGLRSILRGREPGEDPKED